MDFVEYETRKYRLYRSMKRKHIRDFRRLRNSNVKGACNIERDLLKLYHLIKKYKSKIKCMEESEYGDIIIYNYRSST